MKLFKEIEVDDGLIWVQIRMNLKSLEPILVIEQQCMNCSGYSCSICLRTGKVSETYGVDNVHKLKSSLSQDAIKKVRTSIKEFVDLFGEV